MGEEGWVTTSATNVRMHTEKEVVEIVEIVEIVEMLQKKDLVRYLKNLMIHFERMKACGASCKLNFARSRF